MNLLITNAHQIQAYVILRCLRSDARRIVITEGGDDALNATGFDGMAMYSRFVDARHSVPPFAADWLAGRLEPDNTVAEENYVQCIEEICRRESIDVIFPSLDPEVYLFAKNKQRFARQGILLVVPDADVLRIPLDKSLTMRTAQRVGFPCPVTFYPASVSDIPQIVAASRPPWIVKPRFTAHGQHMALAADASSLEQAYIEVSEHQGAPIIQEYIEGDRRQNYYLTVNRDGRILSLLSPRATRTHHWGSYRVSTRAAVSASSAPYLDEMRALVGELGLWGGYTFQTKIDPRDGVPKLLEINARLGQHVWWRTGLGVNEPKICLQIARGESPTGNLSFREDVLLLDPYFDVFEFYPHLVSAVFEFFKRLLGRDRSSQSGVAGASEPRARDLLRIYAKDYLNLKPKVLSPEFSSIWSDPYPCLRAYWFKFRPVTARYVRRIRDAVRGSASRATR